MGRVTPAVASALPRRKRSRSRSGWAGDGGGDGLVAAGDGVFGLGRATCWRLQGEKYARKTVAQPPAPSALKAAMRDGPVVAAQLLPALIGAGEHADNLVIGERGHLVVAMDDEGQTIPSNRERQASSFSSGAYASVRACPGGGQPLACVSVMGRSPGVVSTFTRTSGCWWLKQLGDVEEQGRHRAASPTGQGCAPAVLPTGSQGERRS